MTARCAVVVNASMNTHVLQWRGGHVTARCMLAGVPREVAWRPSMEGRSRDRPMQMRPRPARPRIDPFNGGAVT